MNRRVKSYRALWAARPLILLLLLGSGLTVMWHIARNLDGRGVKSTRTENAARPAHEKLEAAPAAMPAAVVGTPPAANPPRTKLLPGSSAGPIAPASLTSSPVISAQSVPGGPAKASAAAPKEAAESRRKDPLRADEGTDGNLPGYLKDLQKKTGMPRLLVNADGRFIATEPILFNTGLAKMRDVSLASLNKLALTLREHPEIKLIIIGHTDNLGIEAANQKISADRADAVKEYLIGQGIEAARLESKGMGSSKPLASNDTQLGRQANRRIEFLVTSAK